MSASDILSTIAPQFDSDPTRDSNLSLAEQMTNRCFYGAKSDLAVALRAAHTMTLNTSSLRSNGEVGSIVGKKEGDLSISFSSGSTKVKGNLGMTHYGVQLHELMNSCNTFVGVTGGNGRCLC